MSALAGGRWDQVGTDVGADGGNQFIYWFTGEMRHHHVIDVHIHRVARLGNIFRESINAVTVGGVLKSLQWRGGGGGGSPPASSKKRGRVAPISCPLSVVSPTP